MNKAFVREPEFDGRAYCPRCGSLGTIVGGVAMDTHIEPAARAGMGDRAWFCEYARCEVAYFGIFENVVLVDALKGPIYPKHLEAPLCACFGFTLDDVEADVEQGTPVRIRQLLAKSQSPDAQCARLAANGRCCIPTVQRLYIRLREKHSEH